MRLIDLTHTFEGEMPVYPGDPHPTLMLMEKEGCRDYWLETSMHVGTHMDAPLHMIEGGKYLSEMPVEKFAGRGYVIDARGREIISEELLDGITMEKNAILLVLTGHSSRFKSPAYFENFPMISEGFATRAVELGVSIVGMDTSSPDAPPFPVHKILLGNEILIIENLTNLEQLLNVEHFTIAALPFKLHADAAPVRVVAIVN
ncbi:cyclase family protein [Candidatus Peregrinibacteria bacterium]|nr:cyclase family protein [Candidatus Peregrinibacteria bacterium]MBI3815970.1 cyclase family protein [Candidatus Peregrinibacteria bacterium]